MLVSSQSWNTSNKDMALKVLTALDHAKTQYYHFTAIMIAGMGLFTDAYDLFSITPVMKLIGRVYYPSINGKPGTVPPSTFSIAVGTTLLGTVIGQIVFGALGDRIGRKKVYGFSLLIMVLSSLASGFSVCRTRTCVLSSFCFFRFWLGVGIGGDYPLSATIISEFANKKTRGSFIAAVFSMQGFGILASSAVTMVFSMIFLKATDGKKLSPLNTPEAADVLWRIILMIGAIPAGLTFYWRMGMPETARYTALVENDVNKANKDIARYLQDADLNMTPEVFATIQTYTDSRTYGIFSKQFLKKHGRHLFACSMAWFIVDIPFYSSTLFQSKIYQPWFKPPENVNAYQEAYNVAKFQGVLAITSTIPGYFATVLTIDRIGRRNIQMMGFFFMGVFLFMLGGPYDIYWYNHRDWWFMILYGLTFFFSNFGPNATTFIVPAELFPARFRTTCHGISGAAGKIGAIIGSVGFLWASQDRKKPDEGYEKGIGMLYALIMLGGVCILGVIFTYFFTPETMGKSLEENEDKQEGDLEITIKKPSETDDM